MTERVAQRIVATRAMVTDEHLDDSEEPRAGAAAGCAATRASGEDSDYFVYCSPEDHHHIAQSQKDFHILSGWLSSHSDDPAIAVRIRQLETRY